MDWVFGNAISIRTIAIGCAVMAVVCSVAVIRPKPLSFPHVFFTFGAVVGATASSEIVISHADAERATALVSSIDDVHSQADLVAYADRLMQSDPRITQVKIGEHDVSMTYQTTNTFLRVNAVTDQTRAVVSDNGTVSLSGSWYRPLLSHAAQTSSPSAGFSDIVMAESSSEFSPSTQARLITRLHGRFQIGALQ